MHTQLATLLAATGIAILVPCSLPAIMLPAGTHLEARFSVPTGSRISRPGDPIQAIVIAPVIVGGKLLVPQGAIVTGTVENVERLGFGLKHLTSGIEYRFDHVQLPGRASIPIDARVVQVETAKERVNPEGIISGIYPTANLSSTVAYYALPLLCMDPDAAMPIWGIKLVIARSPDPEIYFPAGTEMVLELTANADLPELEAGQKEFAPLSTADETKVREILARLPQQRADNGPHHPSDLVNLLVLGSRTSIASAFAAAGWSKAQTHSLRSIYRMYHSMVQRMGYSSAPMGNLTLNGAPADVDYEKSLDTFSKRHHIRLWKGQSGVWLSAATEDVGYAMRTMHVTHITDPLIDNERAKVLNDLAFTGCVNAAALMTRGSALAEAQPHSIATDQKIAVLRLNDCRSARPMPGEFGKPDPRRPSRIVQALFALRDDLIRSNPISLVANTTELIRMRRDWRKKNSVAGGAPLTWSRPTVLDLGSPQATAQIPSKSAKYDDTSISGIR